MNCKENENRIIEYVDNTLSPEASRELDQHIAACESCKLTLKETQAFLDELNRIEPAAPSDAAKTTFLEMLEEEKQLIDHKVINLAKEEKEFPWKRAFQVAASIVLLFSGYFLGSYYAKQNANEELLALQKETVELKENMMLTLMENRSPSKRIQAVNYAEQLSQPDEKVLNALIERLEFDTNLNVRIAAAEALTEFSNSVLVKDVFIKLLKTEKNPDLQIAIIQFMVKIKDKRALNPMQKLLNEPDTPDFVKQQVEEGIAQLI